MGAHWFAHQIKIGLCCITWMVSAFSDALVANELVDIAIYLYTARSSYTTVAQDDKPNKKQTNQ